MTIKGYIFLFAGFIFSTAVLYLPVFFILRKKGKGFIRQSSYLLCFWSLFLVVFATVILFNLPISFKPHRYVLNIRPFQWLYEGNIRDRIITEIRPNIMIFIPPGFLMPVVFKRMRKIYATASVVFAVTFVIEFFQYFTGRSSDVDDLIANLTGGLIGYGIFKGFGCLFRHKTWWKKFLGA